MRTLIKKEMLHLLLVVCLMTDINVCDFDSYLVRSDKRGVLGLPGNYNKILVLFFRKKSLAYDIHWLQCLPTSL